jgi:hypothetical protein
MAATTRWIIDTNWTAVTFTAGDLNSLANGGSAVSTAAITNGTALDMYADVSLTVTVGGTTTTTSYLSLYVLPLQQDGTTYGDGSASSSSAQPVATYLAASSLVKVGVASGSTVTAMFRQIVLPPGDFVFALGNNLGVALNATAALTMKYRAYDENLNA